MACRLAAGARVQAVCAAYVGEAAALLPPCLVAAGGGGGSGGLPGAALHRALQEAAADVAAVVAGRMAAQLPRDDALQRLVTLTAAGGIDAYVVPQPRPLLTGDGRDDTAAAAPWSRAALMREVGGGLLSAVRSLRATQGGRVLEAAASAASAWAPAWVTAALQPAAAAAAPPPPPVGDDDAGDDGDTDEAGADDDGGNGDDSSPLQQHHEPCEVDFAFADAERGPRQLVASPDGLLLLLADTSGRVTLLDAGDLVVLRVWKGYRDAQVAWVARAGVGADAAVVIFAPRRAAIEVWSPHGTSPLASVPLPPAAAAHACARLIASCEAGSAADLLLVALPLPQVAAVAAAVATAVADGAVVAGETAAAAATSSATSDDSGDGDVTIHVFRLLEHAA